MATNTLNAQCLNRILPNCGPNILPLPVSETILPNQMIIGPNYAPPILEVPYGLETVITNHALPSTTIIQDSTVANNLANALQLLVVSNLLSNTLPTSTPEIIVPGFGSPLEYGLSPINPVIGPISPYNYIY
ncbi:hypothetical protein B5X24_HaOG208236 [Helicoverpa armigera]|uniref:Uncharacterized protein n=1 Tax=Helicoverpa armigera TaxID=29058 RepID=A0A2W1BKI7_HELAM|nr:hypothetical protein B5X24_HaOG208236 [Helicoverpa armigera]